MTSFWHKIGTKLIDTRTLLNNSVRILDRLQVCPSLYPGHSLFFSLSQIDCISYNLRGFSFQYCLNQYCTSLAKNDYEENENVAVFPVYALYMFALSFEPLPRVSIIQPFAQVFFLCMLSSTALTKSFIFPIYQTDVTSWKAGLIFCS